MAETTKRTRRKKNDPRELARFIEEFSWLMKSFDGLDFSALSNLSREISSGHHFGRPVSAIENFHETTKLLVGLLPSFLMDVSLFRSNEDIVEFANAALGMELRRWQKKSKYEIIGQIVCHTNDAPKDRIEKLCGIMEDMQTKGTGIRKSIEFDRSSGTSWSDVIGRLYDEF